MDVWEYGRVDDLLDETLVHATNSLLNPQANRLKTPATDPA